MSAQDDELALDAREYGPGDTQRSLNGQEDFEEENNAPQSTQSTWKGFDSDDEAAVGPPGTPERKVDVVIYNPSSTETSADELANVEPSPPAEELIADAGDDNVSVFSMTNYGSMDWDHTGDELDKMEVAPKITRRDSTTSPENHTRVFYELAPLTPRNKRRSTSSISVSEKRTSSLQRDSKGRFAPKSTLSSATPCLVRDGHGRFAPKNGAPAKRRASMGTSAREKAPRSLLRDEHGRFASKGGAANRRASTGSSAVEKTSRSLLGDKHEKFARNNETSATTLAKKHALSGSPPSAEPPRSLERALTGKFAPKKETPIPPPKPLAKRKASVSAVPDEEPVTKSDWNSKPALKETPILPPKRLKLAEDSDHPSPEPAMDDNEPIKANTASKPAKAKRPPAKSPYFVPPTPPISPEFTRKGKEHKSNKEDATGEPTTPQKDSKVVPSTPGSGKKRSPGKAISCIPFPPLSAPHFGLIQEKLAHDPFRLLIAVTFLIRTHGKHAIPVFFELMEKYPTPESLAAADLEEIVPIIRHLGLQNQRANTYQMYAKIWLENPPTKGKRYPVRGYPNPESARDVKKGEILDDDDGRHAWEIGHMTQGPYAIDSWRIFCRDRLRGEADSWNGEGRGEGFQPEWMRVLPQDKELRAYLRWMWLKEGFEWDPFSGEKDVAGPELMRAAMEGRIAWDDQGGMRILDEPMSISPDLLESSPEQSQVSTPRVRDDDMKDELA
jgi:methyl-CpG-binding domain protein 4